VLYQAEPLPDAARNWRNEIASAYDGLFDYSIASLPYRAGCGCGTTEHVVVCEAGSSNGASVRLQFLPRYTIGQPPQYFELKFVERPHSDDRLLRKTPVHAG
jgi:hypothetical protein